MFIFMSAAILSAALSTMSFADERNSGAALDRGYSKLNSNNDRNGISRDEWGSGFDRNGTFKSWDTNRDGLLSPKEHRSGYFSCFDRDKNGRISRQEHHRARRNIGHCGLLGG